MKRLPSHTLTGIKERTGIPKQMLSDYLAGRRTPKYSRAKDLSEAILRELGVKVDPVRWLEGDAPEIIRAAIFKNQKQGQEAAA